MFSTLHKSHWLNVLMLVCTILIGNVSGAWAEEKTSTLTFSATCGGSGTANDGTQWTITSDASESTYDGTKGIHYGTNSSAVQYISLTTSDISGTIKKVVVNASTAKIVSNSSVSVTVGSDVFGGAAQSITDTATNYTFEGASQGSIIVTIQKPTKATGALYCKQIVITYDESATPSCAAPTFSPAAGTYSEAQNVVLSTTTEGATIYYTIDGSDPTTASTQYTAPIAVSQTTTIKAIAAKEGFDNSSVATATYTISQPSSIADVRAQATGDVFTKGVVTSVSGRNAYIQDATAAILVYANANFTDLAVGDEITVSGTLSTYNGLLEITSPTYNKISSDNTVEPELMTIAQVLASDKQGWLVKIVDATVQEISNYNVTVAQGESTIVVRFNSSPSGLFKEHDLLTLTGNIGCYNAVQIANPTELQVTSVTIPSFTLGVTSIEVEAELQTTTWCGSINFSVSNYDGDVADIHTVYCDAEGNPLEGNPYSEWFDVLYNSESGLYLQYYFRANNTSSEPRYAYVKLYVEVDGVKYYSDLVTFKQLGVETPVIDYAELPFEWEGGASAGLLALKGVTANGLGTDYAESNAPYLVKLDGTGDYIQVKTNERPGIVTIGVKMAGGSNTSTITVQESADGETFTDVQALTISGAQYDILNLSTNTAFAESSRYVRLVFTKGSNVGVGPITIAQYADIVLNDYALTIDNPENVNITANYGEEVLTNGDNAEVTEGTEVTIAVTPAEGFDLESITAAGAEEGQTVTLTESVAAPGVYTFTMPAFAVTISATVTEHVEPTYTTFALATSITSGKTYIIASSAEDGAAYAMAEQKTNNRGAASITIADGIATVASNAGVHEFVIAGDDTEGYTIYDESAESTGYLYAAGNDKNHLKTQTENNDNGIWTITIGEDGEASVVAEGSSNRNVMQYNLNNGSPLFNCYATASQSPVYLYEKVEESTPSLPGDVNRDGDVTIADVTALVNIILGKDTENVYDHEAADVNGDGDVTIADVTALVNIILGKN